VARSRILKVALDTPLDFFFDYGWTVEDGAPEPQAGQFVLVPFGHRETAGLIVDISDTTDLAPEKLKQAIAVRSQLAPLSPQWIALCRFAADYYQRPLGEVAVPGVPKNLRAAKPVALDRALKKMAQGLPASDATPVGLPALNRAQQDAADAVAGARGFAPTLLYGVTGSGKTEVYLQAAAQLLAREGCAGADSGAGN
jgi:primosomal protein N' (replication factor Y)